MKNIKADICIIGAGSGGLSVSAGAAQLGLKTVLLEKHKMGGDCLNTGCVPSKALLAAAKQAYQLGKTNIKGVKAGKVEIDYALTKEHVLDTIETIEENDSQERFEGFGVTVIREAGKFTSSNTVQAGDNTIEAKHFVICTGSRARVPNIEGLDESKILTNENIFDLKIKPEHLVVIGGGPIGIEMSQAHLRLGCKVTVLNAGPILNRDDADNAAILRESLLKEGLGLIEGVKVLSVNHSGDKEVKVAYELNGEKKEISGTHLLVATGRITNTDGLDLEKAGIDYGDRGIKVGANLKTSNDKVFAIGDVSGGPQFTHVAGYHAGLIIKQVCFKLFWTKTNYDALPWVTYTDPELAQVGMTEAQAREKLGDSQIKVSSWKFDENDRAIAERKTIGQIKVVTNKRGVVIGASIVGSSAGEHLPIWILAISKKLKVSDVAGLIFPYPTFSEVSKRAASAYYTPSLFSEKTKKVVGFLKNIPL